MNTSTRRKIRHPDWGELRKALESHGLDAKSVVAYGYYGSQANGLATEGSDEDIFVIMDTPVKKSLKMLTSKSKDYKLLSVEQWPTECEMLFDVVAIGNIIYPEMVRRESGTPEKNPWAAYVRNYRASVYHAAKAARSAAAQTLRRLNTYLERAEQDEVSLAKRRKTARKEYVRARKMEDYVIGLLITGDTAYRPIFNESERDYVLSESNILTVLP